MESRFEILLENIQEQNRATIEAVFAQGRQLNARIDSLQVDLTRRIEVLEIAVRQNSEDIRRNSEDIKRNSEDIKRNSEDIKRNSEDIRTLFARVDELSGIIKGNPTREELKALELRVISLEQRLGVPS